MKPTTVAGRMLSAFLRGLLPETDQFTRQIAEIEEEARTLTPERLAAVLHAESLVCAGPPDGTCYLHRSQASRILAALAKLEDPR